MGCNDASHILNVNVCIHILSPKPTQPTHHHQLYNTSLPIGRMFWMVISASGISASKLSNSPGRRISHVELLSQGYAFSNHKTNNSIKVYLYIYICIHACVYIIYSLKNPKLKVLPQNKNFGPYIYIYIYYIYIYISLQLPTFPFKNLPPIFLPSQFCFHQTSKPRPMARVVRMAMAYNATKVKTWAVKHPPGARDHRGRNMYVPPPDKGTLVVVVSKRKWTNFIFQANHVFQWFFVCF